MAHRRAPRLIMVIVAGYIAMLLQGCAGATTAHAKKGTATAVLSAGQLPADRKIARVAARWERDFDTSSWKRVRQSFSRRADASALISQMIQWRLERVRRLTILPTYIHRSSGTRYVATLRFTDDPRAVPAYRIYLFELTGTGARVIGTVTGLKGSDFTAVRWAITRSNHFTIFHSPYEVQGSDRQYLADLEFQRSEIEKKFALRLPERTSYYLYPATNLMSTLTSRACGSNPDNVGCTNPYTQPPSIQTSVWPTYHEPIHVYELALEPPRTRDSIMFAPLFVAEGTAVALEDRTADPRLSDYCSTLVYVPLDACARAAINQTRPLDLLRDRGFMHADPGSAYALGGSFVKFLILSYGYRSFGRFYYQLAAQKSDTEQDYNVATERVFNTSVARLLQRWERQL